METPTFQALCKYQGFLVIAQFTRCQPGTTGKCPECGATEFHTRAGWVECDCGFAIDKGGYDRMTEG